MVKLSKELADKPLVEWLLAAVGLRRVNEEMSARRPLDGKTERRTATDAV